MSQQRSTRLVGELTSPEIAARLRASSILCLPVGSLEQHGPHLPLNTDAVLAEAFTRRITAKWAETYDLWQLPTLPVSLAREHQWADGTLSLSTRGMVALLHDVGREIARGFPSRNLAIINGHGGNRGILEAVVQDLRADAGLNACVLHPPSWLDPVADGGALDIHGGKIETSMMLAVAPQLVRRDHIKTMNSTPRAETARKIILDPAVTWPWTTNEPNLADAGVIGDPASASAEFGEQLLNKIVEAAGDVFRQLLDRQQFARG